MKFSSRASTQEDGSRACESTLLAVRDDLGSSDPHLIVAFTSGHDPELFDELAQKIGSMWPGAVSLGCSAEGTVANADEFERRPSLSLMAGILPQVEIRPFSLTQDRIEGSNAWVEEELSGNEDQTIVALGDPFTLDPRKFLADVNQVLPGHPVLGGLASHAHRPGDNRLLLDGAVHQEGLVGVALSGNIHVDTVVSQGCRPIGESFIVTQGEGNVLRGLRNEKALEKLRQVHASASPRDQQLMDHGLFLGRAIDEYKSSFDRGDFLIQGIMQADPESGALVIGGEVRVGTTVQFHVRDAESADEDLRQMLQPLAGIPGQPYAGALLFSCNGRGTRMWEEPGHDAGVVSTMCGKLPVSGFFCAGELGPIGGQNFLHGFTASIGLIRSGRA